MCGVIGFVCKQFESVHADAIRSLFRQSRIRGMHAFGHSYLEQGEIKTRKYHRLAECVNNLPATTKLIGHCRYSTSGDYNNHENNQPIHVNKASLVFNGVVTMAKKSEYEQVYERAYQTENDGEIVLDKFVRNQDWKSFVANGKFSFAGLILSGGMLIALRNSNRPMYRIEEINAVFYASTADIFKRAGFQNKPMQLEPGKVYVD